PPSGYNGERVVAKPLLRDGHVLFTTLIPAPKDQPCKAGGSSWLMEIGALTGAQTNDSVFDIDNNGKFDDADKITDDDGDLIPANGIRSTIGIVSTPTII